MRVKNRNVVKVTIPDWLRSKINERATLDGKGIQDTIRNLCAESLNIKPPTGGGR